ncbi:MAG: hypothetical protein K2K82_00015 [Muribaculaceae bacterium]|nr:hypothetical protein [Muribaculaceae bacterium]
MNILRKAALSIAAFAALSVSAFTLDLPIETINGKDYYVYRVAPKETVYSITRKLGITRDELIAANPAVADGLRAGETLLFPTDPAPVKTEKVKEAEPVKPTEPAKKIEPTEQANPVEPVKQIEQTEPIQPDKQPEETKQPDMQPKAPELSELADAGEEPADTISVAVILPFMLESENLSKSAENFTNFYRGFILAADSLSARAKTPVLISAYDSEGSAEKLADLVSRPEIHNAAFIIAPEDPVAIANIVAVTDSTDAMVLNLFAVKDDCYRTHESLLQGNICHDAMYSKAIDAFCKTYKNKNVIILNATDIPSEKNEFTTMLSERLLTAGIPFEKIDFSGKLTDQNLTELPADKDYVFIPTSHSRETLMRILPALESFKASNSSASLFGYPEWIILQGNIKDKLNRLNTTIYSRFASDPASADYKNIIASYKNIYGTPMDYSIPNQTLLGFDTAAWILCAANAGVEESYKGIQNSFKFKEIENGGFENTSLYFITYAPDGSIVVTLL